MKHMFQESVKTFKCDWYEPVFNFEDELLRITKQQLLVAQSNLCARPSNQGQINTFMVLYKNEGVTSIISVFLEIFHKHLLKSDDLELLVAARSFL